MNPFFFGDSTEPLYGVYHPARNEDAELRAILLCYPMGVEYMRAHRAFRQLTHLLVRAGIHVLRFDYHGTGDSAGDGEDATLARWEDDIVLAAHELMDNAGVPRLGMAGLRLGGTLAARAAARIDGIDRLLLWDPVVSGRDYLAELRQYAEQPATNGNGAAWPGVTVGVGGFPLTPVVRDEILAIRLEETGPPRAQRIRILASDEREADRRLSEAWHAAGANCDYRCVPSENRWAEGDAFGSALIPQDIIRSVVEFCTEGVPQ